MEEHMEKESKSENDVQNNEMLKKESRDVPTGATAKEKVNENDPDDVLKSVEDDFKLMRDVFNFLKKKNDDIKGKEIYPEDCNTATKKRSLRRYASKYSLEGKRMYRRDHRSNETNTARFRWEGGSYYIVGTGTCHFYGICDKISKLVPSFLEIYRIMGTALQQS